MTAVPTAAGIVAAVAVLGGAGAGHGSTRAVPAQRAQTRVAVGSHVGGLRPVDVAVAGVTALALGVVLPPLGLLALVTPVLRARRGARRADRASARRIAIALPDTVDLLLLGAGAGLSLPLTHALVADRAPAPLDAALRRAVTATDAGTARADALLAELVPLGDRAAALAHVLVDHLRYGVPLVPGLERIALELRLDRRRRAEEEARRVPLRLLAPLLCCVLPAFGLLTVVPLLVASLRSLPL